MDRVVLEKHQLKSYIKTIRQLVQVDHAIDLASKIDFQLNQMDSNDFGTSFNQIHNKEKFTTIKSSDIKDYLQWLGEFKPVEIDFKARIKKSIFKKYKANNQISS